MRLSAILFCICITFTASAQSLTEKIQKAYDKFENDPQTKYGISSITILNSETGEVLFSKNPEIGLTPASTLKTVTSITAFNLLGKDFTWNTYLGYSGTISSNGTLDGDIILRGEGDPTLGSFRYEQAKPEVLMERWTKAIRNAGIKRITGSVISDDRLFGTAGLPTGWIWQDIGSYYGAGASALTWTENQYGLIFKAGAKVGDPTTLVRSIPKMDYIKMSNESTTGSPGSGDNTYIYAAPYTEIMYIRGTYGIDLQKTVYASIPDPAFEVAYRLQDTLQRIGIASKKQPNTYRKLSFENQALPAEPKIIDTYTSVTLEKAVYWFNQKSINLYGEQILKTMTLKQGKNINTSGADVVKEYWSKRLSIDPNSMKILDGSGLSPETRITTSTLARILQTARKETWFPGFYESLPTYNNMKMKSGSIKDVIAYAGYQTSSSGVPLTFSFIMSNYNGGSGAMRQKIFTLLDALK